MKFPLDKGHFITGGDGAGWYRRKPVHASEYIKAVYQSQAIMGDVGFYSNIIENHDEPRGVSHYLPEGECLVEGKKMLALLSFMVRGLPFIYEGQEIGMENKTFTSIEEVDDCSTMHEYQAALEAGLTPGQAIEAVGRYCRDNARTPMQWDDSDNAGFTAGKPWLAVNPNYKQINVKAQQADEDSVLAFYKKLIALRKSQEYKETVVYGELIPVPQADENVMVFYRKSAEKTLLVAANYQAAETDVKIADQVKKEVLNNKKELQIKEGVLHLSGYQAVVLEVV